MAFVLASLIGPGLSALAPKLGLFSRQRLARLFTAALFVTLMLAPIVPIGTQFLSPAAILSGMLGELSSLTLVWCLLKVLDSSLQKPSPRVSLSYLLAALTLAWTTLTYVGPDVYRWGYLNGTGEPIIVFAALALLACWLPGRLSMALSLATLSWALGLQASTNLWDYLIDVPSALFVAGQLIRTFFSRASHA
jgi:hypothetical protein